MTERSLFPTRRAAFGLIGAALVAPRMLGAASLDGLSGAAFGTTWQIVGPPRAELEKLRPGIEALFSGIDAQMSPWRADSALSRFNAMRAGRHAADPELIRVTQTALSLAASSDGAFDPTVGPLVARWGFGPIEGGQIPDWRGLAVGEDYIGKARDDLTLDLCGIAKGRALDLAVELAQAAGVDDVLFDLGGELRALGRHPSGRMWRVAVQHPLYDHAAPAYLRLPDGQAIATSGLRAQSYDLDGRRYGHIIDPAAGSPAGAELLSVTVLAGDAMMADGWATALFAAGAHRGPDMADGRGVSALFLVQDGAEVVPVLTGAMAEALL